MTRLSLLTVAMLGLLFLSACQGNTPATPATTSGPVQVPIAGSLPADALVFGAWDLTLDPATATASLVPSRAGAAFGDSWWLNATGFLNGAPCTNCLTVESIRQDPEGHPLVTFRARHPFAPGDPGLPPTGANRLDLHVFDAQLLVVGDLGNTTASFGAGSVTAPSRLVLNPAGFSGALTSVANALNPNLSATVFPYVTLAEDPTPGNWLNSNPGGFADLQNPTGSNVFAMGADITTEIALGIVPLDGSVKLTLMFTASYGQSAVGRTNRLVPVYPLPEYNAKAPWKVELNIDSNDLAAGQVSSTAQVSARVWDWQAAAPIDSSLNDIAAIRAASAPASVSLAIPGLLTGPLDLGTPIGGTGPFDDPLVYTGLVLNQAAAGPGMYHGILRVTDDRATGLNAGAQPDALSSTDGTTIDPVALTGFATYQTMSIEIEDVVRTLLALEITPDTRQIIAQGAGEAITFTATGTFDTPPLTEAVSLSAVWDSSALDVGTFATNVLTGVGMGTTTVSASMGSVTSNTMQIIVKPEMFLNLPNSNGYELDAHQEDGEIYFMANFPNQVRVFDEAGTQVRSFPVTLFNSFARGITVDKVNDRVFVGAGQPEPTNSVGVYTLTGTQLAVYKPAPATDYYGFESLTVLDNEQLWYAPFTPSRIYRFEPLTGATQTTWTSPPGLSAPIGVDQFDNLMYVANVGGRGFGQGILIANPATQTVLALGSITPYPPGYGQNNEIAVDRDGFIHLAWDSSDIFGGGKITVEVYEYLPPNTISGPIYQYQLTVGGAICSGIAISRPGNVVVVNSAVFDSDLVFLD